MHEELKGIPEHMLDFSVGLLGHALWHVLITGRGATPWTEPFGLVHAAHGGELLLKATIARQHPLLIFSRTPARDPNSGELLSFAALVKSGRTRTYAELPDTLWATTGFELPDLEAYRRLGELRNTVQHFAAPALNYRAEVLAYLCRVADPVLRKFWGTEVFRAIVDGWGEQDSYMFDEEPWVQEALVECGIQFDGWVPVPDPT